MIRFENVNKKYGDSIILQDLSFHISPGELVVLVGPSGCGKTTTLKLMNRLVTPDSGRITINGKDVSQSDPIQLRRSIGYVIQNIGLFPTMTVAQNICVVPRLLKYSKECCEQITRQMLELVNMPYEEFAHKYPDQLSGGQQQRVGVLRAVSASPSIVLMDEPFGALDPVTRTALQHEIKQLQQKLKKTIIFVTHDMDEALMLADRILFMDGKRILQNASPEEILKKPATQVVADFLGSRSKGEGGPAPSIAAELICKNIPTVTTDTAISEAVKAMELEKAEVAIVSDPKGEYRGVLLKSRATEAPDMPLNALIENIPACMAEENAKTCVQCLLSSSCEYMVVLKSAAAIGLISKTEVINALTYAVWEG